MKNKAVRSILSDVWHCREIGRKYLSRRSGMTRGTQACAWGITGRSWGRSRGARDGGARPPGEFYNWRTLGNMRYLNTSINISHRSWCPSTGLELELGGRWIKHWILTKCLVLTLKLSHIQIPSHKADPKSCFLFSPLIRENEPSQLISHWITVLSSHPSPGSSWGKFIL